MTASPKHRICQKIGCHQPGKEKYRGFWFCSEHIRQMKKATEGIAPLQDYVSIATD